MALTPDFDGESEEWIMEAWIWVVLVLVVALGICGFVMYRQMREQEAREQGEQQV